MDGHSACGKSTLAKAIANELQYIYVDTGAMYRAVTYYFLEHGYILPDNEVKSDWEDALSDINVSFNFNATTSLNEVFLNGVSVEDRIRMMDVSQHVSAVSKLKLVREKLVVFQKKMGKNKGVVMDGRDIGTVVFPDAEYKFFLTASPEERARRRQKQLIKQGISANLHRLLNEIEARDARDMDLAISPLRPAVDAVLLDSTELSIDQVVQQIAAYIQDETD